MQLSPDPIEPYVKPYIIAKFTPVVPKVVINRSDEVSTILRVLSSDFEKGRVTKWPDCKDLMQMEIAREIMSDAIVTKIDGESIDTVLVDGSYFVHIARDEDGKYVERGGLYVNKPQSCNSLNNRRQLTVYDHFELNFKPHLVYVSDDFLIGRLSQHLAVKKWNVWEGEREVAKNAPALTVIYVDPRALEYPTDDDIKKLHEVYHKQVNPTLARYSSRSFVPFSVLPTITITDIQAVINARRRSSNNLLVTNTPRSAGILTEVLLNEGHAVEVRYLKGND